MGAGPFLRVGLIGSGFMGRAHAYALAAAPRIFDLPVAPTLELLADVDTETAARAAAALGFKRSTGDWRALITDSAVDVVDITAPNAVHREMALAAISAGKPVYCEKPLAPNATEAKDMVDAAEAAGVPTAVGFNYLKNPISALAKSIIDSGEIGEVFSYRGQHFEDYMIDPTAPFTWRHDPAGGDGVVGDLASHAISMARFLVGDIVSICADRDTLFAQRPTGSDRDVLFTQRTSKSDAGMRTVEVADQARALVRFANGSKGTLEASWVASGRKMNLAAEITGTKGAIRFDFERLNELELYVNDQPPGREGFKRILAGPEHPPYAAFTPAPGHQLGFNDMKLIEVRDLFAALSSGEAPWPDFREAWEVQRVVDALTLSAKSRSWLEIAEV